MGFITRVRFRDTAKRDRVSRVVVGIAKIGGISVAGVEATMSADRDIFAARPREAWIEHERNQHQKITR